MESPNRIEIAELLVRNELVKWSDLQRLMFDQLIGLDALGQPDIKKVIPPLSDPAATLTELDHVLNATICAAVHAFCVTGVWPKLSAPEQLLLMQRLEYAHGLCASLSTAEDRGLVERPKGTREQMIRWLIVDAWEESGYDATFGTIDWFHRHVLQRDTFSDN